MYSRKTSWNRPLHGDFNAGSTKEKENAPREKKTILNEENLGNYRKKRAGVLAENEDYFNTTFEAEDILHEIDHSPSYGEKKGKLYSFLHWQRKKTAKPV